MKTLLTLIALGCLCSCGPGSSTEESPGVVVPPPPPPLPSVTSIAVTPDPASVDVGETVSFAAIAHWSDGSVSSATVSWSTGDEAVASITAAGVATGVAVGSTTVRATLQADSSIFDDATLAVNDTAVIYAHGSYGGVDGLHRFDIAGGAPVSVPMFGADVPPIGLVAGIASRNRAIYLVQSNTNAPGVPSGRVFTMDMDTNLVTPLANLPTTPGSSGGYQTLNVDTLGRLYTINAGGGIHRIDTAGVVTSIGTVSGFTISSDMDASDNLYVQNIFGNNVRRRSAAGTWTTVFIEESDGTVFGNGMCVSPTGTLFVDGTFIFKGEDLNSDGDCLDAGEVVTAITTVGDGQGAPQSMIWTSDGLLVNAEDSSAASGGIYRFSDGNGDGDMDDAGERTEWSAEDVYSSPDYSNLRRGIR